MLNCMATNWHWFESASIKLKANGLLAGLVYCGFRTSQPATKSNMQRHFLFVCSEYAVDARFGARDLLHGF